MRSISKTARFWLTGTFTCLLLTGLFRLNWEQAMVSLFSPVTRSTLQMDEADRFLGHALNANLQESQAVLLAQGTAGTRLKFYVAAMSEENVVPNSPNTSARGAVGAALSGNRLIVRGSFKRLSSAPRDYASDPIDPPNPSITSAFHIHLGDPHGNGPFQYALNVTLGDTGRGGSAAGEYTLTPEQKQALADGCLYVDIHTTKNRGGELRGILMPY